MITAIRKQCITILLLSFFIHTHAQDRAQDHNSSRSNKTASKAQADDWTFGVSSGASFGLRSNEGSLFRGNSMATKLFSRYHFGNIGLGFSSGIVPGAISSSALNAFIVERKFQQAQITKSNPFNSYLLFGPSFRFGNRILVTGDIQGGMFINNPGAVSIGQTGAVRSLYRFEGAEKNLFPGFSGNISLAYPINSSTRFFINTDYLQSKSSIRLYDPQRGIDVATEQDRSIKLFTVGVGITKSFGSKRDAASGQATGKRSTGHVKYENILITEDAATGERIIATTQKHAINTKGTGATNGRIIPTTVSHAINTKGTGGTNGRIMNNGNCGPVTQTTTNPDGTKQEMTFACPDDAANYTERISMNVTVPKQTQGATFGEKVNAGLHAAGSALSQGASRGVVSGTVSWGANNSYGIITNHDAVSSVGNLAGGGGGAAAASYAATGRMMPSSTLPQGINTTIYTREAGSGMATGKRSARDHASGMATGKRQYAPIFNEGETNECAVCPATVKLIGHELTHTVQQAQGIKNPLYNENGNQGTNPMYEGKSSIGKGEDNDCDGVEGLTVFLINTNSRMVVATTKTTTCGNFFFANVPAAAYLVKVTGGFSKTKNYDVTINSEGKLDMAGEIKTANDHWTIQLNTDNNKMQKAGISTSRSNIRTKNITIVTTDIDGNGEFELTKCILEFYDGSVKDVTASSKINSTSVNKKVTVRGWDPEKKQERMTNPNAVTEYTINITDGNRRAGLTSQYVNGTKKESQVMSKVTHHPNVVQWIIPVDDTDTDVAEAVVKTKTKSNQSNDRVADATNDGIGGSTSYSKNLPVFMGDIDDDGLTEILTGNSFDAVNNSGKNQGPPLLGGVLPGGGVISSGLAMPGDPIPGLDVKLGKNPGGSSLQTTTSNAYGEFEFVNMKKGNYTISAELNYYIDDETMVIVRDQDDDNDGMADRKGWDGTVKGGSVISDAPLNKGINEAGIKKYETENNSSESQRKGWDGTVKGGSKAQDHNSSRSNKSSSITDDNTGDVITQSRSQDHNSSRSNKTNSIADNNTEDEGTTTQSRSQDHNSSRSNKTGSVIDNESGNGSTNGGSKAQDHNSTRSNKSGSIIDNDQGNGNSNGGSKAQDHNSTRSNKSGSIADNNTGDGTTEKSIVNTTKSNTKDFLVSLDELDQLLNADKAASASAIKAAKENSRLLRSSVKQLENNLENTNSLKTKSGAVDTNFAVLLGSINKLGQRYSTISNVLKTKHDTAKNSIGNIR